MQLLLSPPATEFLQSIIFWDEKRPISIKLLKKLSLKEVAIELDRFDEYQRWAMDQQAEVSGQLTLGIV